MATVPQESHRTPPRPSSVFLLCLLLFLLYLSNLRALLPGDTIPTRFVPFSLLLDGSFYLDKWVQPYLQGPLPHGPYFVTPSQGHWMSSYPILTPVVVTPLYVLPAWWLSRQPQPVAPETIVLLAETMEKLCAALLATLSAGILYVAFRKITSPAASLLLTLVYALASSTASISSQALWTQGLTQLAFAFLLWSLLRDTATPSYAFWVGLALAVAVANKPPNALLALPLVAYFVRHERRRLLPFCAPLVALGALLLAYNLYFFGHPLGAYPRAFRAIGYTSIASGFRGSPWDGIDGLLVSPNRGLFVFMPWTLFALWGAVRLWKENTFGWGRYLIAGTAALFLLYAQLERWWGGWTFGPRYLTDLMPFFAFFLVPVWPRIQARLWIRTVFVAAIALALWVQVVGVYYYPAGDWDSRPVSVDDHPERLWDWSDTQIGRTWRAGPARPDLPQRWREFFRRRQGGPQPAPRRGPERPVASAERLAALNRERW